MEKTLAEETKQLECELNEERSRYQNLLTEHRRLEDRHDDLKEEMTLMVVSEPNNFPAGSGMYKEFCTGPKGVNS